MPGLTEILLGTTTASCLALLWRCARLHTALTTAEHDARHDALTGLPNRRALLTHLNDQVADRTRPVSVALLDLNRFKDINDEHGHAAGDAVLRHVAHTLTALNLPDAYVGRLSGDEFLIITNGGLDHGNANAHAAARALAAATVPFFGTTLRCAASIGTATADDNDTSAEQLLSRADVAMYHAKRLGEDVMSHFPYMEEDALPFFPYPEGATVLARRVHRRRFR
ncbi:MULTISPECIES: GGDEF domain-containing protein [Micromonospora]|uniref:GGDEF domain-containing protein n=1 Tax=Micromonospora TaxID=1873 RepID=UPI00069EBF04|nr:MULTISPECIES: GGDEF domain-containing protein [unclassified Micromonospora]MDG4756117.1 GGDEF domain-containing protein [Micromonospora sp. WMMD718]